MAVPEVDLTNAISDVSMLRGLSVMSNDGGLNKSARFAVRIQVPGKLGSWINSGISEDLVYLCEAAEMPGRAFMSVDARYYGPNQKLPYQTQYEDTTMTFLCRADSKERKFFDDWMELINPSTSFDFEYRENYHTSIDIFQLTELESEIISQAGKVQSSYLVRLEDAYPININPQPMTWADDQYLRLAVTFTYFRWYRPGRDPQPAPSANNYIQGITPITDGRRTPINFID